MSFKDTNLVLRSEISADGMLDLWLDERPLPVLKSGEVRVRMEAAPVNPSDMGLMLASADLSTANRTGAGVGSRMRAELLDRKVRPFAGRIGIPLPVGNEGTGTVVDAAPDVADMIGRQVSLFGGGMYARYRTIAAKECLILPAHIAAEKRASLFVNPMTALAMVETMRMEGHGAIIHTAAASSLGQMLIKICKADGVDLVNIVRGEQQVAMLKNLGAQYVVDGNAPDFHAQLRTAVAETRATIAFDAIGGGRMTNILLQAMEASELRFSSSYSLYGSDVVKQIYIYGSLDLGETGLDRSYGYAWSVSAFLVTNFLKRVSDDVRLRLLSRIASEYDSTFATQFARCIRLTDLLEPNVLAGLTQKRTGDKYLILFDDF
ncbi:Alcohol dehydrogenase GroES-like protein [Sphingobium chlorophenolicum]|uniref:Alcohol dehydrogenase GroES-like protein n=2 Tax=Sphingobium chlorophenolicum TaxID=46429 RepID=A0A081RFC0_SPHCR|nr:Alcohol dehydrogenase GroES-like protein [Sphingobium chlorophenolicum]